MINIKIQILLFLGIFGIFAACSDEIIEEVEDEYITIADTKYEIADSVEILYSDSAIIRVRITAPLLLNYSDNKNPRREFPKGILVEFFDENQKIQSRLTAKTAVQYEKLNKFIVEDSVVVKNSKNEMIETEGLVWDESTQRVHTERFITITTATEIIKGYGFESDYDFQNWELKKVSGRLKADRMNNQFLE